YRRLSSGLPVYGAELRVHSAGGAVVLVTAQLPADPALASTVSDITAAEAGVRFNQHHGLSDDAPIDVNELVAYNEGILSGEATPTVLAYHIRSGVHAPGQMAGFVDAATGEVLWSRDVLHRASDRFVFKYVYDERCGLICNASGACVESCYLDDVYQFAHQT